MRDGITFCCEARLSQYRAPVIYSLLIFLIAELSALILWEYLDKKHQPNTIKIILTHFFLQLDAYISHILPQTQTIPQKNLKKTYLLQPSLLLHLIPL